MDRIKETKNYITLKTSNFVINNVLSMLKFLSPKKYEIFLFLYVYVIIYVFCKNKINCVVALVVFMLSIIPIQT